MINEQALKERIKIIAKEKAITFNEAWKQLLLERFLARLAKSEHHEKFIFKGGLLLSRYLTLGRETYDIDLLLTKTTSNMVNIEYVIKAITQEYIEDGFSFQWDNIEELKQPHMEYPGYRINICAIFGKLRDKIQIDIGVGDLVSPERNDFHSFEYKGKPIFEGEITLLVYPVEIIFAEKLETIISKGSINSRMKDYHDVLLMTRESNLLNLSKMAIAIKATFGHRGTELKLPLSFDASAMLAFQTLWINHCRSLGDFKEKLNLPDKIDSVILEINDWLRNNGIQ